MREKINILFTSSGRRVSLIKSFKKTFIDQNIDGKIITADLQSSAPTKYFSDNHYIVPKVSEPEYISKLMDICIEESINLIIPLIDTELSLLSKNRSLFKEIDVTILVSGLMLNEISNDKNKTYEFFIGHGIKTPKVYNSLELMEHNLLYPLLIKPYNGSGSKGVTIVNSKEELIFFKDYIPNALVQEYIEGKEYTVDVMVDLKGNIKTIVPRMRIETRAGEVSKGITKKNEKIISATKEVIKVLPEPFGCITLQCFEQKNGDITFIEINPRFGGGVPLSIAAGANFPLWTIQLLLGEGFTSMYTDWKENFTMLRFDEAVFTETLEYD